MHSGDELPSSPCHHSGQDISRPTRLFVQSLPIEPAEQPDG